MLIYCANGFKVTRAGRTVNYPAASGGVIYFLSEKLPANAQLIVGSEIDTEHPFDRTITLDVPYKLLEESAFDHADSLLEPMVKAMYSKVRDNSDEAGK